MSFNLSFKKLIILCGLFWSSFSFAGNASYYGIIKEIEGLAFVTAGDRTIEAKPGMRIFDHSEVMTTAGSQVTFMDRYDHLFHLSSSGHAKVFNQIVELKRGYLWVQSMRRANDSFALETANSQVIYQGGEGILSFDESTGKSQFLAVKGSFLFGNTVRDYFVETVREGHFSFIEDDYKEGMPRRPMPVGYQSYERVTQLFSDIKPLSGELQFPEMESDQAPTARRGLASTSRPENIEKGRMIYVRSKATTPNKEKLRKYYTEQLAEKSSDQKTRTPERSVASASKEKEAEFRPRYDRKSGVKVQVFGRDESKNVTEKRAPSSKTKSQQRQPASLGDRSDAFEAGLGQEYNRQQRHSDEVNSLIRDLRSYDRDFKTSY